MTKKLSRKRRPANDSCIACNSLLICCLSNIWIYQVHYYYYYFYFYYCVYAFISIEAAPEQQQWMTPPPQITGCPPGLEYLCQVDELLVKQQVELLEGMYAVDNKSQPISIVY